MLGTFRGVDDSFCKLPIGRRLSGMGAQMFAYERRLLSAMPCTDDRRKTSDQVFRQPADLLPLLPKILHCRIPDLSQRNPPEFPADRGPRVTGSFESEAPGDRKNHR